MAALAYMERLRVVQEPPAEYVTSTGGPTFSALPHAVLFDTALTPGARLTYAVLQSHWWQGGECWASHATLARQIGCKERMLRYYLRELTEAGYVSERRRGHGQAKAYAPIQAAIDCQLNRQEGASSEPKRQPVASQAATECQFKRQPVANRRRRNEEDSPKEEDTGVRAAADAAPAPEPVVSEASKKRSAPRRSMTATPDDFPLTDANITFGEGLGFDRARVEFETRKFLNRNRSVDARYADWQAAWRNWLLNAKRFDERDGRARPATKNGAAPPARRPISQSARDLLANDPEWGVKR